MEFAIVSNQFVETRRVPNHAKLLTNQGQKLAKQRGFAPNKNLSENPEPTARAAGLSSFSDRFEVSSWNLIEMSETSLSRPASAASSRVAVYRSYTKTIRKVVAGGGVPFNPASRPWADDDAIERFND